MLLGENAAGKSTVLEAVALTLLGTKQIARMRITGQERLQRVDAEQAEIVREVRVWLGDTPISLSIDRKGRFSGNAERVVVLFGYGPRRFFAPGSSKRRTWHPSRSSSRCSTRWRPSTNPEQWLLDVSRTMQFALAVRALRIHCCCCRTKPWSSGQPPKGRREERADALRGGRARGGAEQA